MESEPKKPGDTPIDEKKRSDAAAISARIVALKGDSDEYTYAEPPPKPAAPPISPKAKGQGLLAKLVGVIAVFLLGVVLSIPIQRWLIGQGGRIGARLQKSLDHPVATINGEVISADEFAHSSEISAGRATLQRLIDDKLVLQFARKLGVTPDPKDVDAKFNEMSRSPAFFQNLKRANESPEDYRYNLLITMCKQAIISNGIKVNPSEIQDYYKRNIDRKNRAARFYHPESVQVAVIISPDRSSLESAQKEMAGGLPFASAVLKYSADASKAHTGILPPIRKGSIDPVKFPGLEKVLFDLQNGNTSDITQIGKFYWLIKCLNHMPETVDPFDKVEEECTTGLLVERGYKNNGEAISKQEQDFVKASNITISLAEYADLSPKKR